MNTVMFTLQKNKFVASIKMTRKFDQVVERQGIESRVLFPPPPHSSSMPLFPSELEHMVKL